MSMKNSFEKPSIPKRKTEQVKRAEFESTVESDIVDFTDEALLLDELNESFEKHGLTLNWELKKMLEEDEAYRWEKSTGRGNRTGSGYVTATRYMADLFKVPPESRLHGLVGNIEDFYVNSESAELKKDEVFAKLKSAIDEVTDPGSKLLGRMMLDLVIPLDETKAPGLPRLPFYSGEKKVGTCTTAELYFLDKAYGGRRGYSGWMNAIVDDSGEPVMLEKVGLGNSHSCLTLTEVIIEGVRIPAGSLVYVDRVEKESEAKKQGTGVVRIQDCEGFSFLRFTTLALPPEDRQSFGKILQFQIENDYPHAEDARLEYFKKYARNIVDGSEFSAHLNP